MFCKPESLCRRDGKRGQDPAPVERASHEDEFVWILEGELTLISKDGEELLRAGDCVAFIAGEPDGHHLVNRSAHPARLLEIGNADPKDRCVYPDIDLLIEGSGPGFTHRDGTPYPAKTR